jgi:hypothetical protein
LLFAKQAEENVLGPDVVVPECARLFLGKNDDLPGSLRESLEHQLRLTPPVAWRARSSPWGGAS